MDSIINKKEYYKNYYEDYDEYDFIEFNNYTIKQNKLKDKKLRNLGIYFNIYIEENNYKSYETLEEKINIFMKESLNILFNIKNPVYIDFNILSKYSDINFINLCKYLLDIHKNNKLFNDYSFYILDIKFMMLLIANNIVNLINNTKYNYNKFNNLNEVFTYNKNKNFKNISENIILFIKLLSTNKYKDYAIPFDLIIYMIVGKTVSFNLYNYKNKF